MVSPLKPKRFDGRSQHPNLVEKAKKFGQSVFNGLMGFRDSVCLYYVILLLYVLLNILYISRHGYIDTRHMHYICIYIIHTLHNVYI
jgi:hypothetical protein